MLGPTATSLRVSLHAPGRDRAPIEVPADRLPALVVGMIWRSYGANGIPLTRLSTDTYLAALTAFEQAVAARA